MASMRPGGMSSPHSSHSPKESGSSRSLPSAFTTSCSTPSMLRFRLEAMACIISLSGCSSSSPPTRASSVRLGSIFAGALPDSSAWSASNFCFSFSRCASVTSPLHERWLVLRGGLLAGDDGHGRRGAQAVGPRLNHLQGVLGRTDAARGLHAHVVAHHPAHEGHVL